MNTLISQIKINIRSRFHSQLFKKFFTRYLLLLFIPMLLIWMFYSFSLTFTYEYNKQLQQENYIKSAGVSLSASLKQIETIFDSFQSTKELVYYMDSYYTTRPEMLYTYKKSIEPLYNNLCRVNSNVESIHFYCDNTNILFVGPFLSSEDLFLNEDTRIKIKGLLASDIFWKIVPGKQGSLPEIYAYKKIYSYRYNSSVGYIEIKTNSSFLTEYMDTINSVAPNESAFFLLDAENMIYNDTPFHISDHLLRKIRSENISSFNELFTGNYGYRLYNEKLGLYIVTVIHSYFMNSRNVRLLFICSLILLLFLLYLSLLFFTDISHLSNRIRKFSLYLKDLRKQTLLPYKEPKRISVLTTNDEFTDLISSFNKMVQQNTELTNELHRLELLTKDARLAAMQAQIHPHFIYGTLESIRMLALQNNDSDVEEMVLAFSKFMRYSLTNPSDSSTLGKELESINQYLKIQLLRFGDRLQYDFSIDKAIEDTPCPPFILQPLIENAIIHGISCTLKPCQVKINVFIKDSGIIINVANTGATITPGRLSEVNSLLQNKLDITDFRSSTNGFALHNVNERLSLFYHGKASLLLSAKSEWTISKINIQIGDLLKTIV